MIESRFLLLSAALAVLNIFTSPASASIVRRAVIDIGSGSTKLKVADVDTDLQIIAATVKEAAEKVDYKSDLSRSEEKAFSETVINEGLAAISKLVAYARQENPTSIIAVATSAFRDAKNAAVLTKQAKENLGIEIKIISQHEEALNGYFAGVAASGVHWEDAVVWDIGTASVQIIARTTPEEWLTYEGQLGSVAFKNHVIALKGLDPNKVNSPNPIGTNMLETVLDAAAKPYEEVSEELKKKIANENTVVVGIGSVHGISIKQQLKTKDIYTQAQVYKTLQERASWDDEKIGGKYASTEVANLALVHGAMQALNIEQVLITQTGIADGILVNPDYWAENDSTR